jgi:serine/threonine protein kinase
VLHQIGVGALGPVFRTYEPTRDRLVAVKVFRLDITPEQAQALADELARAPEAGLFHPSIVEPIAAGVQGTVAYRAEEYVPAESLDVAMRHYAPATPDKVLPFITQLAGAIDFARAAGVGHGALHPRDIFVTPEEARATGFGVVDALERVGLRAPVRRPYTPPERVAGEEWGTPADVFSLAAIAFEMLTARRPPGTGGEIGVLKDASAGPHADFLRAVLAKAMHERPENRYPNALAFAAALEAAARGQGVAGIPQPAAPILAAPAAVPVPVDDIPPERVDDIATERDEDEAHWVLTQQEQQSLQDEAVEPEAEAPAPLFDDEVEEAAADRLVLDAADLALDDAARVEPRFVDEFGGRGEPANRGEQAALRELDSPDELERSEPVLTPERAFIPIVVPPARRGAAPAPPPRFSHDTFDRSLAEEHSGELPIVAQRSRTAMLPLAVMLMVGLLLGYVARDLVGKRAAGDETTSSGTAATTPSAGATPGGTGQAPPAGKEWSEQAVGQAPGTQPPAPPAVAPAVPAEQPGTQPSREIPQAAPQPRTARLVVRSTPSGAGVTVNGRWSGRTPLALSDLAFGDYVVRVVADGYRVGREEFKLSAGDASRTLTMTLERERPAASRGTSAQRPAPTPSRPAARYFGTVYVDSRPQGATVYIAGKQYGKTPLRIPEVPIGSHVVRLELPDHRTWTKAIRVTAGEEIRATGSLEPIR